MTTTAASPGGRSISGARAWSGFGYLTEIRQ